MSMKATVGWTLAALLTLQVPACDSRQKDRSRREPAASDPSAGRDRASRKDEGPRPARQPRPRARAYNRETKAIVGVTVVDTRKGGTLKDATVLIQKNRIASVGPSKEVPVPADADVIDGRGKYLIPGLVDGHIHFFQSGGLYTRPDGLDLRHRVPYEKEIARIRERIEDLFRRYLRCGVTTVVDVGGPFWNFEVRQKASVTEAAPRVFATGPLIASYQPKALASADLPIIRVDTVKQAVELVRRQIERKADLIKIWYVVSKKLSLKLEKFYPIVKAVVAESHKSNVPVYVHATELETARKAVEAGADVLVHSVVDKPVDEPFLKLAKERKVFYTPTLWVMSSYQAVYSKQFSPTRFEQITADPHVIKTLFEMRELSERELGPRQKKLLANPEPVRTNPIMLENLKRVHDFGIPVVAGTDAGNVGVLHGPAIFRDFALMKKAGLTNAQILSSATYNAARMLRKEKDLGSIEKGKLADLLLLDKDPLKEIMNTTRIRLVMKDGKVFHPDDLVPLSPVDLVQIQLNAYNHRDIETFVSTYAPDIKLYRFPDKVFMDGIGELKRRYSELMAKAPKLHCRLVNRITFKNYVVDREHVTGIKGRSPVEGLAVYQVEDGLIRKVWFFP